MSLLAQQLIIGQSLLAADADGLTARIAGISRRVALDRDELNRLVDLVHSPDFGITRRVQRSWCLGRTEAAAELTLSALPPARRRSLVEGWVAAGGGTAFDPASDANQFLEFVASRLPDEPHEMPICRMEQAVHRASEAAMSFTPPDSSLLDDPTARVVAGRGAALVRFLAEPRELLEAIRTKGRLPPISGRCVPVLFAPGFAILFRVASAEEVALWGELSRPITMRQLSRGRYARATIAEIFRVGAAELTFRRASWSRPRHVDRVTSW